MELHLLSWNVNGIRAWVKKTGTLAFISRFNVVCLNETKIDAELAKTIEKNFKEFPYRYFACSEKKGYAGVAVFSKIKALSEEIGFNSEYDREGRVITLEFERFFMVSSYFPNSGNNDQFISQKMKWNASFCSFLSGLMQRGKEVVWLGDLNIVGSDLDYYKNKSKKVKINPAETSDFESFLALGFTDTFRHFHPTTKKFTWFNGRFPQNRKNNNGWRIDFAMVSNNALPWVEQSLIHDTVTGSDHCPIELILFCP